ncbi:MAG TPA: efflux RND transporter periplasmic adaptor subunit [Xanthomonadaceae bacterium]|nr:efflux RND transporter periplasmic adaptor subunit [Xanthomonadaceae bacterium]
MSGASMDVVIPKKRGKQIRAAVVATSFAALFALGLWLWMPRGLQVEARSVTIATVARGTFEDAVTVRATAESLNSVILDSVESGRVEEVFAHDGTLVKKGDTLFRLSNPERLLELLKGQSDEAQQVSNGLTLRVDLETARTQHRQRTTDLEYAVQKAQRQYKRNQVLAAEKYISNSVLEDSADQLAYQTKLLNEEKLSAAAEIAAKSSAAAQMDQAIAVLQSGLKVASTTVEALTVRAPVAGRLTDFSLQVGETVKPDEHIGRIDDPAHFKLSALVDEFYVNRIHAGASGVVQLDGQSYSVRIGRVFLQIKAGQFEVELLFDGKQPSDLSPGQSVDANIIMGEPSQTLLLPSGTFFNDTGGAWVYVVDRDGETAKRRVIRVGRRGNSQIEILSGLSAGDRVIVSGYAEFGNSGRLQLR